MVSTYSLYRRKTIFAIFNGFGIYYAVFSRIFPNTSETTLGADVHGESRVEKIKYY